MLLNITMGMIQTYILKRRHTNRASQSTKTHTNAAARHLEQSSRQFVLQNFDVEIIVELNTDFRSRTTNLLLWSPTHLRIASALTRLSLRFQGLCITFHLNLL